MASITGALHPPPPPMKERLPLGLCHGGLSVAEDPVLHGPAPDEGNAPRQSNSRCCVHNFWSRVPLCCAYLLLPCVRQQVLFPSDFGNLVLLLQGRGGWGGGINQSLAISLGLTPEGTGSGSNYL